VVSRGGEGDIGEKKELQISAADHQLLLLHSVITRPPCIHRFSLIPLQHEYYYTVLGTLPTVSVPLLHHNVRLPGVIHKSLLTGQK
jgi:hypothetical protein